MKIQNLSAPAIPVVMNKSSNEEKTDNITVQNPVNNAKSVTSAQILSQMPNVSFKSHSKGNRTSDKSDEYENISFDEYAHSLQPSEAEKNPPKEKFNRDDFDDDYAAYCHSCINASHYQQR